MYQHGSQRERALRDSCKIEEPRDLGDLSKPSFNSTVEVETRVP